ncbi:hypothetical protein LUZ60_010041 [Juncus effusus]|nr:hypothetical protein LUZ60_010041 [Juncus effusus]
MAISFSLLYEFESLDQNLSLPLLFITLLTLLIFIIFQTTKYPNPKNLPPSPPSLPLLGHLHRLGLFPHRSLQALSSIYGPIMFLRLGRIPTIILSSASVVEESIRVHDSALSSRPQSSIPDMLLYGSSDVAFSPYGEYWRQVRRVCVLHLLSTKRVQSFSHIREQEVSLLIDKIRFDCSNNGEDECVVNLTQMLVKLANDIVCRAVLGQKYSAHETNHFHELISEFVELLGTSPLGDMVPWLGWVDWLSGLKRRAQKNAQGLNKFLENVIEDHLKTKRDETGFGGEMESGSDLVDVLLNINETDKEIGVPLTRDNIKAIILDMFAAGTDTVSTALEWTMAELINNPEKMNRVIKELTDIINASGKLTENLTERMTYLKASIKEAFRLHPPIALLIPRESTKDIKLSDYHVPMGTRFVINAWAIGKDPKYWERPQDFWPDRFLDNNIDFKGQHFGLIPFGTGRRSCPGIGFANSTIELALANLLYHFDWKLPDGTKGELLDMTEKAGISVHRKNNLVLVEKPHYARKGVRKGDFNHD